MHVEEIVARLLTEYGQAHRHDWSDFDGRGCLADMSLFASWLRSDEPVNIADARNWLGMCPIGSGHWQEHCDIDCSEPTA